MIRSRNFLPQLELKEWPEATAVAKEWLPRGDEEAFDEDEPAWVLRRRKIDPAIEFGKLDGYTAAQITGGVTADLQAGPYVSLILAGDATKVTVVGRGPGRLELDGRRSRSGSRRRRPASSSSPATRRSASRPRSRRRWPGASTRRCA